MRKIIIIFLTAIFLSCASGADTRDASGINSSSGIPKNKKKDEITITNKEILPFIHKDGDILPVTSFKEIWGYVVAGSEAALKSELPITDVAYFGAEVDIYGTLVKVPNRRNLSNFSGKVHLSVVCGSQALTYFTLLPGSSQRRALINDLIAAAANFDGINIDFENIPPRSGDAFLSFLRELRAGLGNKTLTIALYGRTRALENDVYDYAKITPLVDRVFIMAYDEHWIGSKPGPISTIGWCRSVAEHGLRTIGKEKLIMGIPFYGRAWESKNHNVAYVYAGIEGLINTYNPDIWRENGTPTFDYQAILPVKVYYEDEYSISARFEMYKSMGVNAVGFWRIGQETPKVWDIIRVGSE